MEKKKILVMDDDEQVRVVSEKLLQKVGYEVQVAKDGVEAIQLYEEARLTGDPYDVVIIDLQIEEGMGGEETIKKLKQKDPEVKAILSTGDVNNPIFSQYKKFGFIEVISKPYNIDEFYSIVNEVIRIKEED
ncbi:MAG: response regulator [Calditrichaeota bacterium]|nr:MAG: response regulator [Calditrichota bacterium]